MGYIKNISGSSYCLADGNKFGYLLVSLTVTNVKLLLLKLLCLPSVLLMFMLAMKVAFVYNYFCD